MPHRHSDVGSDDLASSDEIKVFEDEGEDEEKRGEHLTDEKSSLITDSEQEKSSTAVDGQYASSSKHNGDIARSDNSLPLIGKPLEPLWHTPLGYGIVPSFHSNGSSMTNKVTAMVGGPHPGSPLSFMMHNIEFRQPPPAHMGIPYDAKTGIPRPPMYPLPTGQYSHSVFPELTQWHSSAMYPMTTSAFRGPYLPNLTGSSFANFSPPSLIPSHGLGGHPSLQQLASSNQKHQDLVSVVASGMNPLNQSHRESLNGLSSRGCLPSYPHNSTSRNADPKSSANRANSGGSGGVSVSSPSSANHSISSPASTDMNKHSSGQNHHHHHNNNNSNTHKYNLSSNAQNKHIKKPLNAFMLYMKDKRSQVVSECTLKESAAINQILGKRWHSLPREEQAKYYDLARKERQLHLERYPGWTAKDNYAINQKKKKKKRDKSTDGEGGSLKKCRARFGLDNQTRWCKPCRRKKKCVRFSDSNDTTNESEDNVNSVETIEAPTPDSKSATETDSDTLNVSPLGLSLSSPSVPSSEYMLPHISNTLSQSLSSQSELTPRSQSSSSSSTLASLSCPPRNSPIGPNNPLSIEQLTRPHCPLSRSSAPSTPNIFITTSCVVSNCVATQRS